MLYQTMLLCSLICHSFRENTQKKFTFGTSLLNTMEITFLTIEDFTEQHKCFKIKRMYDGENYYVWIVIDRLIYNQGY